MENKLITNFEKFGLSPELMRGLKKMNFQTPFPVQEAVIEPMLDYKDVLVQAPTGTGKTAAFGIPIIERIDPQSRHIQTIILCPTRELALQTTSVLRQLAAFKQGVRILALYGGEPIHHQITALKRRPQIIVATPGRLLDHMNRHTTRLNQVNCVVLDEADRMLDMGFREDIATIMQNIPDERQTVLFSATVSKAIEKIASTYQTDAQQICIKQETLATSRVEQYYSEIRSNAKTSALIQLLNEKKFERCIVFVATKAMADSLAQQLIAAGHLADSIHGDLHQRQRNKVMQRYRDGKISLLVATDVAARGIDVDGIDAVVNYDIPGDSDSYVHRIGRTGRANRNGVSYTFVCPKERGKLQSILYNTKATILPVSLGAGGFKPREDHASTSVSSKTSKRKHGSKPWDRRRRKMRVGA